MKRRGQATAIGAIFFLILVVISLSYFIWASEQLEELHRSYVKGLRQERYALMERMQIFSVDYQASSTTPLSAYTAINGVATAAPGAIFSLTPVSIGSTAAGIPVYSLRFDFSNPANRTGWNPHGCTLLSCSPILVGTTGSNYLGFYGFLIFPDRLSSSALWYYTFYYDKGDVDLVSFQVHYGFTLVTKTPSNRYATWYVSVYIVNPSGLKLYLGQYAESDSYFPIDKTRSGTVSVPAGFFSTPGNYVIVYEITAYSSLAFNTYTIYAYFYGLNITLLKALGAAAPGAGYLASAQATFTAGVNVTYFTVKLNLASNVSGVAVDLYLYDFYNKTWRFMDGVLTNGTAQFTLLASPSDVSRYSDNGTVYALIRATSPVPFNLTVYTATMTYSYTAPTVNITVYNTGTVPLHIVSIWIDNSTVHKLFPQDAWISPGEERTFTVQYELRGGSTYLIKVVTSRGNIFATVVRC